MTKTELETILKEKNVPKLLYSLDGLKNGECYCVVQEGIAWKVVYMERGRTSDIATGLTESEACDLIYREFQVMYGWLDNDWGPCRVRDPVRSG
jgi:hypothetical protein